MATKQKSLTKDEAKDAAKALELLFTTEYVSKRELYKQNFIRGLFFSAGTILGAAIIVALSIWLLSLFDSAPLIGPAVNSVKQSIESSQK